MRKIIKDIFCLTPFYPVHLGEYLRMKYFFRYFRALPAKSFRQILDAGCGSGDYALKLAMTYPHLQIIGKDVKKFEIWDESPHNVRFKQQDLRQITERNRYDFCLCIDVLEHIPENRQVLENIYKSLKLGGYFYLHIPSQDQQRILSQRLFKKTEKRLQKEHIGQMYTLKEIKEVLKSTGFGIIKAHYTFGFWGKLGWELDRLTDEKRWIKIVLMPLLKLFACFDYWLPKSRGNGLLVVSKK